MAKSALHHSAHAVLFIALGWIPSPPAILLSKPLSAMKIVMVFHTLPVSASFLWATASWMALINWVALLAVFTSVHRGTGTRSAFVRVLRLVGEGLSEAFYQLLNARCVAWACTLHQVPIILQVTEAYTRQPLMLQQKMQFDSIYISCDPPCFKLCIWSRGTWCLRSSVTLSQSIIHVSKRPLLADIYRLHPSVFLTIPHVARVYRGKFVLLYRWWTKCENINFNHLSLGGFTGLFGSASRFDIISV